MAAKRRKLKDGDNSSSGGDKEIDALFQLPLNEFTAARNALASRLARAGNARKAAEVKALAKPSISAWVVNRLYWKHRQDFNRLIESGRRMTEAQTAHLSGKSAGIAEAQAEQREAASMLSRLADSELREAGHNPTPGMMRRVGGTLEALSAYSSIAGPDAPRPGRLTADVDPPGFESLARLIPPSGLPKRTGARVIPFSRPAKGASKEATDQQTNASAKALQEARRREQAAAAALKEAAAEVDRAERRRLEAEEKLEKTRLAEKEARERLDSAAAEAESASKALERLS